MTTISSNLRELAKHTSLAFEADRPPIFHFWDDNHISDVYILEAVSCPQLGVTSYATIGLSEYPLIYKEKEFNSRVEIVGACGSNFPDFSNVLATLAFCVINSKWFCAPGIIFPDVLNMYNLSGTMSDIYFTYPFLWADKLKSTVLFDHKIAWLLAVPISREESAYAQKFGSEKLEVLFSEKDIDIFDLNRKSVV